MVKLCIIETENHHEVIRSLVQSLYGLDYAITIITHAKCIPFLTYLDDCRIIDYQHEDFEAKDHFKEHAYDRILFTTPPPFSHSVFRFLYPRSYLLIHNIHFWISPYEHLFFWLKPKKNGVLHLLKWIKYLPEIVFSRWSFLSSFKKILAPSYFLYDEHRAGIDGFLDLRFPSDRVKIESKSPFTIVLPGTINETRNYTQLIHILDQITQEHELSVVVQFLGRGRVDVPKSHPFLRLNSYPDGLDQETFDDIMSSADIGLLYVDRYKSYKGILEEKGISNISGAVNDFYRFGIPALVPSFYPIDKGLHLLHHYDLENLKKQLTAWMLNKDHLEHLKAFAADREAFARQVREHNHTTLSA